MRIYIAGALSSKEDTERNPSKVITDYIQNINKMCQAALQVMARGHAPYIPGLDFMVGLVAGDMEEEDYRGVGMSFLEVCDAVVIISDSWGVQQEVKRAKELGIKIFTCLGDVPNA